MIELNNVTKKYKNQIVLNDISLKFCDKKAYGISGTNGSGKTQLLKAICGHIVVSKGDIIQDGIKIRNKDNFIEKAGIVFDNIDFIPDKSAYDNLKMIAGINKICDDKRLSDLISYFGLTKYKDNAYYKLSLGNKKKMAIIQALLDNPKVLILDEPFNGLDKKTSEKLVDYLVWFKKNNLLILTSHNENDLKSICDEIIEIEEGYII